jgi:hypothetical protein
MAEFLEQNMRFSNLALSLAAIGVVNMASVTNASLFTVVNDTTATPVTGHSTGSGGAQYQAEEFITGSSGGQLSSVSLDFYSTVTATLNVYLFNATATGIGSEIGQIGQIDLTPTGGSGAYSLFTVQSLVNDALNPDADYAIVVNVGTTSTVGWEHVAGGTTSGFIGAFNSTTSSGLNGTYNSAPKPAQERMMEIQAVPEPITQAMLTFGSVVLLVSLGDWGRKRFRPVVVLAKI